MIMDSGNESDGDLSARAWAIMAERVRQRMEEGWTPEHDDAHPAGALEAAACCCALHSVGQAADAEPPELWPWEAAWWKPGDPVRDLEKAGARPAAAMDRRFREAGGHG